MSIQYSSKKRDIYIKFLQCLSVWCMYVCLLWLFFTKTTNIYISTKNKDNDTKPSGYDPWGLPRSSMSSRMTLSSMSPVRNPQCPPSTPLLDPPSWHPSNWDISTKFSGYLPWSLSKSSIDCMVIGLKAQGMGRRPKWWAEGPPTSPPQELEWRARRALIF